VAIVSIIKESLIKLRNCLRIASNNDYFLITNLFCFIFFDFGVLGDIFLSFLGERAGGDRDGYGYGRFIQVGLKR